MGNAMLCPEIFFAPPPPREEEEELLRQFLSLLLLLSLLCGKKGGNASWESPRFGRKNICIKTFYTSVLKAQTIYFMSNAEKNVVKILKTPPAKEKWETEGGCV